jgi:hypothetical protein
VLTEQQACKEKHPPIASLFQIFTIFEYVAPYLWFATSKLVLRMFTKGTTAVRPRSGNLFEYQNKYRDGEDTLLC